MASTNQTWVVLNSKQDYDNILSQAGDKLVVIYFGATWCGPCRAITPVFENISRTADLAPHVVFCKVDVDVASEVAEACEIQCMPTFCFYRGETRVCEFHGGNEHKLKECIAKYK